MNSEVSYLEIGTKDAGTARVFFGQLFGWGFHPLNNQDEGWFETPGMKAGLHGNDSDQQILIFFSVPNLMTAIARVQELGGQTDQPGPDEPGFGQFCLCRDPQGIRFGLHQRPKANLPSSSDRQN